jgi:hypothetical protein
MSRHPQTCACGLWNMNKKKMIFVHRTISRMPSNLGNITNNEYFFFTSTLLRLNPKISLNELPSRKQRGINCLQPLLIHAASCGKYDPTFNKTPSQRTKPASFGYYIAKLATPLARSHYNNVPDRLR